MYLTLVLIIVAYLTLENELNDISIGLRALEFIT